MPFLHKPKEREPLWKEWDYLAQKKGVRHTVYSVNGNEYTGEWLDNKKDGRFFTFFSSLFIYRFIKDQIVTSRTAYDMTWHTYKKKNNQANQKNNNNKNV